MDIDENTFEQVLDNYLTGKNQSRETLHNLLVYFFKEYEGKLSRNNNLFAKLMKSLDYERKQVLLWIKEYTTLVSCKSDFSKLVSSDQEAVMKDGRAVVVNRIHLKDNFINQKWYDMKAPKVEKDYTIEDFKKAVEALKKKAEKNGIDYKPFIR